MCLLSLLRLECLLLLVLHVLHVLQQHCCGELILRLLALRLLHELQLLHLLYLLHRVCLLLLQLLRLLLLLQGSSKQLFRSPRGLYWLQRRKAVRVRWRRDDEASAVLRLTCQCSISGREAWSDAPLNTPLTAPQVAPQRRMHRQQRRPRAAAAAVVLRGPRGRLCAVFICLVAPLVRPLFMPLNTAGGLSAAQHSCRGATQAPSGSPLRPCAELQRLQGFKIEG
jgi:hypothetical protein